MSQSKHSSNISHRKTEKRSHCKICGAKLSNDRRIICGKKSCKDALARQRYKEKKDRMLLSRPCPCCGKIIPNKFDKYCSEDCIVRCEGISIAEERFVREHEYNIVVLANMARLLPENRKRLNEIEDRLRRKYGKRYKYILPRWVMLAEFGFTDGISEMADELYDAGLLTGDRYEEVAFDISIYRKLFDYGVLLGHIE